MNPRRLGNSHIKAKARAKAGMEAESPRSLSRRQRIPNLSQIKAVSPIPSPLPSWLLAQTLIWAGGRGLSFNSSQDTAPSLYRASPTVPNHFCSPKHFCSPSHHPQSGDVLPAPEHWAYMSVGLRPDLVRTLSHTLPAHTEFGLYGSTGTFSNRGRRDSRFERHMQRLKVDMRRHL